MDAIDRIYYLNKAGRRFIEEMYGYSGEKLEFFPLGGSLEIKDQKSIQDIRDRLKANDDTILMFHTGKIIEEKRTKELLEIFSEFNSKIFKLVIIGSIEENYMKKIEKYINNENIVYMGWMKGSEMIRYLSAGDVYLQPGYASATLQSAICSGNAVVAFGEDRYGGIIDGNGWIIESIDELKDIFRKIEDNPRIIDAMKKKSEEIAREKLNYGIFAEKMYDAFRMKR